MSLGETLEVNNFAGLSHARIEVANLTIFIGPQASGKSVCAKLLFYFKDIITNIPSQTYVGSRKVEVISACKESFLKYFPPLNWGTSVFNIRYTFGQLSIEVIRKAAQSSDIDIKISAYFDSLLVFGRRLARKYSKLADDEETTYSRNAQAETREAIRAKLTSDGASVLNNTSYFIPSGRSFYSNIQNNALSFLVENNGIDPFVALFGKFYEAVRLSHNSPDRGVSKDVTNRVSKHASSLIGGRFVRRGNTEYILSDDKRQVAVENASSGQQEALPLTLVFQRIARSYNRRTIGFTFFVEEPEAHLYPTAQREIVHLLSLINSFFEGTRSCQFVITTHSPYILAALNNLMYGYHIVSSQPNTHDAVSNVLGDVPLVDARTVLSYAFGNGTTQSIISQDTGLVKASALDEVSGVLAKEFNDLVDIAFEVDE